MEERVKEIDELNEKEMEIEDDYFDENNRKSNIKINKPKIEQYLDKRRITALFVLIAIISILITLGLSLGRNKTKNKKEKEEIIKTSNENNLINITEEVEEKSEVNNLETELNLDENIGKTPDDYDRLLGEQYEMDNTPVIFENTINENTEIRKPYKKSAIGFSKNNQENNSNVNLSAENTLSPEQQILLQQQLQQNTSGNNQIVDTTPNRQESKWKFLNSGRNKNSYSSNTVTPALSKYEIKSGTMIPAVLITAVNSDLPGELIAQVTNDVHDYRTLKYTLIPKGSKVIGRYDSNITYGQNRILVVWDRIIFPNGNSLLLDNYQGVDLLGNSGLKGKTNNHFWKLMRSVVLSAGINMAAGALEDVNVNINSSSRSRVTIGTGATDVARNVESIGNRMVDRDLNVQPTIQVKKGSRFNIFVNTDIVLPLYKE